MGVSGPAQPSLQCALRIPPPGPGQLNKGPWTEVVCRRPGSWSVLGAGGADIAGRGGLWGWESILTPNYSEKRHRKHPQHKATCPLLPAIKCETTCVHQGWCWRYEYFGVSNLNKRRRELPWSSFLSVFISPFPSPVNGAIMDPADAICAQMKKNGSIRNKARFDRRPYGQQHLIVLH